MEKSPAPRYPSALLFGLAMKQAAPACGVTVADPEVGLGKDATEGVRVGVPLPLVRPNR